MVPLVSETAVLVLTTLFLSQLPGGVIRWMGMAGGLFVFYLAWRTWHESDAPPETDAASRPPRRRLFEGVLLALVSPTPWVFWLLVGGPLFLGAWRGAGWGPAVVLVVGFLLGLVGVHLLLAAAAGYGKKRLPEIWRRRLMVGTSIVLAAGGVVLLWQASVGNLHRFVTGDGDLGGLLGDFLGSD